MATKNTYSTIEVELSWLKEQAEKIKEEVDSVPYNEMEDRVITLMGAMGSTEKVTATKEVQQKARREALKDYALILAEIDKLQEKEEAKFEARGGAKISAIQGRFLKNK